MTNRVDIHTFISVLVGQRNPAVRLSAIAKATTPTKLVAAELACNFGTLDDIKAIHNSSYPINSRTLAVAIEHRRNDIITYLTEELGITYDRNCLNAATLASNEVFVKLMTDEPYNIIPDEQTMCCAVASGNLNMVALIHSIKPILSPEVAYKAAELDNLPIVTWLMRNGYPADAKALCSAAAKGSEGIFSLLLHAGAMIDKSVIPYAITGNSSYIMRLCFDQAKKDLDTGRLMIDQYLAYDDGNKLIDDMVRSDQEDVSVFERI